MALVSFNTIIGVILGLSAELFSSSGNIVMKYSHKKEAEENRDNPRPIYLRPLWWSAVFLFAGNAGLNFASFAFASLNVLAPTSALTIVINAFLAYLVFGETLTQTGLVGTVLIVVGSTIAVMFGSGEAEAENLAALQDLAKAERFIIYIILHGIFVIVAFFLALHVKTVPGPRHHVAETERWKHSVRALCYGFTAAGVTSWVQLLGKASVLLFVETLDGDNQFKFFGTWFIISLMIIFVALQLWLISEMMRIFDAVLIVPIFLSATILAIIGYSWAFYDSFALSSPVHELAFSAGVITCLLGIFTVSFGQQEHSLQIRRANSENPVVSSPIASSMNDLPSFEGTGPGNGCLKSFQVMMSFCFARLRAWCYGTDKGGEETSPLLTNPKTRLKVQTINVNEPEDSDVTFGMEPSTSIDDVTPIGRQTF